MKQRTHILRTVAAAMIIASLLLASCSRKGVHMSKHRKSRKCNCPTFAERYQGNSIDSTSTITYGQRGRV
ncbi:MAG: hypothetical protein J6031_03325 [Bacteroidales bacterium]|nr:hypothetical protein [Bacteroidales bacterium]